MNELYTNLKQRINNAINKLHSKRLAQKNEKSSGRPLALKIIDILTLADSSRRHFTVEIDRGTMPVVRSDTFRQTSLEEKMRAYLTAHAGKQHERQFGWKTFRVLTVTTDHHRIQSMIEALRKLRVPHSPGTPLFFFTAGDELRARDPLAHEWRDGNGRAVRLS